MTPDSLHAVRLSLDKLDPEAIEQVEKLLGFDVDQAIIERDFTEDEAHYLAYVAAKLQHRAESGLYARPQHSAERLLRDVWRARSLSKRTRDQYETGPWERSLLDEKTLPDGVHFTLPGTMHSIVKATALQSQVDIVMPVGVALGVASAATAGSFYVDARVFKASLSQFIIIEADPSERKSSSYELPREALDKAIEKVTDSLIPGLVKAQADLQHAQQEAKSRSGKSAQEIADDINAVRLAEEALLSVKAPDPLVTDVTIEALEMQLAENLGSVACITAEAQIIHNIAGRYSSKGGGEGLGSVNQIHSGEDLRVRRANGRNLNVKKAHGALVILGQPEPLAKLRSESFVESGFLSRVLYFTPRTRVGSRPMSESVGAQPHQIEPWEKRILALLDYSWKLKLDRQRKPITLTDGAYKRLADFQAEKDRLAAATREPVLRTWLGKAHDLLVRTAALFALLDDSIPDVTKVSEITEAHLDMAESVIERAQSEMRRLAALRAEDGDGEDAQVERLIAFLTKHEQRFVQGVERPLMIDEMKDLEGVINRHGFGAINTAQERDEAIRKAIERDVLKRVKHPSQPGKPALRINPALYRDSEYVFKKPMHFVKLDAEQKLNAGGST